LNGTQPVNMARGIHKIRLLGAGTNGWEWNMDRFELSKINSPLNTRSSIEKKLQSVSIYPNPAVDEVSIKGLRNAPYQLKVYNTLGASYLEKKIDTLPPGIDQLNRGEKLSAEYIEEREITAADIQEYHVKGVWYFDKRQGELKFRLLGIAPVSAEAQFVDLDGEQDYIELFWIFYPDAREILHEAKAFNDRNAAVPLSFDHILNARRFNGVIYKEENVQGDRMIKDYVKENSLMQLLESERIKEKIRGREQDMWNY